MMTKSQSPGPDEILPDGWSPYDPDCPPYWVDELGNFGGWLTEAEIAANDAAYAEAMAEEFADGPPDWVVDASDQPKAPHAG